MAYSLRAPAASDWPGILRAADAALPEQGPMNRQWLAARRAFLADRFARADYVVVESAGGSVVGYGSAEGGEDAGNFRLFIVMGPALLDGGPGDLLFDALRRDLASLRAHRVWTRELASDLPLYAFFRRRGLVETQRYRSAEGIEIVLMELPLTADKAAQ
jgi:hypothetical protein